MTNTVEKSMVPTILVGIGGTGYEVLARVRRLAEDTYGNLEKNFPILGFLIIDTDENYSIQTPEAAGSPFQENEKYWAKVSGREAEYILENMEEFPWIQKWFPSELGKDVMTIEKGAGQIRACGRFAFFFNYEKIKDRFVKVVSNITKQANKDLISERYNNVEVKSGINVFVTGSLSGGTGSGMLLDLGYCIQKWIQGQQRVETIAVVPMPTAFANVKQNVFINGYAALMELNYFSDGDTHYKEQFGKANTSQISSKKAPFDFVYLVGTKNEEVNFNLDQIREMMAQNIFLDLTSEFAPHKQSVRDNVIKKARGEKDTDGRGYPKTFMSFGLSTIEIPISQIRSTLCNRLAQDLVNWWLNEPVQLPPHMVDHVRDTMFKQMGLSSSDVLAAISAAQDRPYAQVIAEWVSSLRKKVADDDLLQCTLQLLNVFGKEKGNILRLVDTLQEEISAYKADHLRDMGPDDRTHGDFLKRMYGNRDQVLVQGREALDTEFYRMLEDRTRGPKFAANFIFTARQEFNNIIEKLKREQEKVWGPTEKNQQYRYDNAIQSITEFKNRFGLTKQAQMETYCDEALKGLESGLGAFIQRKARAAALEVLDRWKDHLNLLEQRLNQWQQRMIQARDFFKDRADRQAQAADSLTINGIKLYDRQELNNLYQDLIEQLAGASQGTKTRFDLGMDAICSTLSVEILQAASPLWKENRAPDEYMRLLDVILIPSVQEAEWRKTIEARTRQVVINPPASTKLNKDMTACDFFLRSCADESEVISNIRTAYQKSEPLMLLDNAILQSSGIQTEKQVAVALLGGINTPDPAAQQMIPKFRRFGIQEDDIKPLGNLERHRIVFVQELGNFSLRCIDGINQLRDAYQDWQGRCIEAKRANLEGGNKKPPAPVHIQKDPPFWDLVPEDPKVSKLVVLARALDVLWEDTNKTTEESVIRYQESTTVGTQKIIASTWEETVQVLQVGVCRDDREKIQNQVDDRLQSAKTNDQKLELYKVLLRYLQSRVQDLREEGGEDSPVYKRESQIMRDVIEQYKLDIAGSESLQVTDVLPPTLPSLSSSKVDSKPEDIFAVTPPPTPPAGETLSGELEKLMNMVEKGFITLEEFQEAKRKLLDRY